jgi:hypothetical protein
MPYALSLVTHEPNIKPYEPDSPMSCSKGIGR